MAFKRTWKLTDSKVPVLVFAGLSFTVGSIIHYWRAGPNGPSDKVVEWIVYSVAGGIIAFFVLWLISFILAPYHFQVANEAEHKQKMQAAADAATAAQNELLARVERLVAERDTAIQAHSALRSEVDATPATVDDVAEAFRVLSDKTSNRLRDEPMVIRDPEEWLGKVRAIAAVALRPIYAKELEAHIGNARNSDSALQGRHQLAACVQWLNGWHGRLSAGNVRRNCSLAALQAAMDRL